MQKTETRQRQANDYISKINTYLQTTRTDIDAKDKKFETSKELYIRVLDVFTPIQQYVTKLAKETEKMEKQVQNYDQAELAKRRSFLDEDPQSGVGGLPGLRTYDDKILLAFWIIYAVFIISLAILAIQRFGQGLSTTQKIVVVVGSLFAGYALAYYCITIYG